MLRKVFSSPLFLLAILSTALLCLIFPDFVFHPNSYLLSAGGDGVKNYFTPAWYVRYDAGLHFTGMDYPFGEHVVFTDNQPLLSSLINWIDDHLFHISDDVVGIMNFLMLFSILCCVLLLYKILTCYRLPSVYAFFAALAIGFMSPQIERFSGHYGLAYSCYIPLLWYLGIRTKEKNYPVLRVTGLIAVCTIFGFIHIYYALIAAFFFAGYFLIMLCRKSRKRKQLLSLLAVCVIPVLIVSLVMHFTDHVHDRPNSPYGFFGYKATFQSVFLARMPHVLKYMNENFGTPYPDFEGYAYVGIFGVVALFISVTWFIIRLAKFRKISTAYIPLPDDLSVYLSASLLTLMFSMALPFSLGLQFLLDWIPPLKQFRSPGRFAWIFYYVFLVYAAVLFHRLFFVVKERKKILAWCAALLLLFFGIREDVLLLRTKSIQYRTGKSQNIFTSAGRYYSDVLTYNNSSASDFQCVLFVPLFLQGSEKLYIDRTQGTYATAMEIAYETGLPLIDGMMSRTSLSQTLTLSQTVAHPAIQKKIKELINEKPILLVKADLPLTQGEKYLTERASVIGTRDNLTFYSLPVSALADIQNSIRNHVAEKKHDMVFDSVADYYADDSIRIFYRNDFDDLPSRDPFYGKGSLCLNRREGIIHDIPVNVPDTIWIEVSFWAKSYKEISSYPYIKIEFLGADSSIIREYSVNAKLSSDIIGDWVRASDNFEIIPAMKTIRLVSGVSSMMNIDNLLVRHTAFDVYYGFEDDGSFWFDNYPVK